MKNETGTCEEVCTLRVHSMCLITVVQIEHLDLHCIIIFREVKDKLKVIQLLWVTLISEHSFISKCGS